MRLDVKLTFFRELQTINLAEAKLVTSDDETADIRDAHILRTLEQDQLKSNILSVLNQRFYLKC
jgi:hypothetical protein